MPQSDPQRKLPGAVRGGWSGGKGTGALPSHRSGSPGQAERGRAGPECPEALTQEAELTNGRWARIHHFGGLSCSSGRGDGGGRRPRQRVEGPGAVGSRDDRGTGWGSFSMNVFGFSAALCLDDDSTRVQESLCAMGSGRPRPFLPHPPPPPQDCCHLLAPPVRHRPLAGLSPGSRLQVTQGSAWPRHLRELGGSHVGPGDTRCSESGMAGDTQGSAVAEAGGG